MGIRNIELQVLLQAERRGTGILKKMASSRLDLPNISSF